MISRERGEIADVRSVAADFFDRHRVVLDDDDAPRYDRAVWAKACRDLGVSAITEPEDDGGLDGGAAMLAAVLVEAGRTLSPLPVLSSAVRAQTALRLLAEPGQRAALLEDLLSGDVVATLAPSRGRLVAAHQDGTWTLTGSVAAVVDGIDADLVLATAPVGSQLGLFAVEATQRREPQTTVDLTRRFARIGLDASPARLLGAGDPSDLATIEAWTTLALAADQVGGAEACLQMSVEYLRTRVQFGRPIGTFQALKHRCADLALRVDEARSALAHLVWALDESPQDIAEAAAVAAVVASAAYVDVAEEAVHLHGGIGFTWEHVAHRHVRRALTDRAAFDHAASARETVLAARGT